MALTKPTVDSATWGNTNTSSPDMVTPGAGLVNTGFLAYPVKLKRGHLNWLVNKLHQGLRYYMSRGAPEWDASETQYAVGSIVSYGGICYICTNASVAGTNPSVDTTHWSLLVPTPPGTLLARRVITASGSYAKTAGTVRARIYGVGCGGGGMGINADTGPSIGGGGGGASGSEGGFETTVIPANWVVVAGTPGAGGAIPVGTGSYTAGAAGTSTTISDGTNTFTFPGGGGAPTTFYGGSPGAAASASPGGTTLYAIPGQRGSDGSNADVSQTTAAWSGSGASSSIGQGGPSRTIAFSISASYTGQDGVDATGWGAGGSGAVSFQGTGKKGGNGTGMRLVLEEWS